MEVSPPAVSDARRFGRYLLAQRIAHGGMASVHLAQLKGERNFSKWVAVKVVHRQYAGDPKFERMFLNEARLLARIDHPNVCQVFDFGEVRGTYFLAMEYLHGQTLQRVMKQASQQHGWLTHGCAARIIADAADGLHAAHELVTEDGSAAKVVHRDVSPTNLVVLYSGVTKVLDFGIARSDDREEELTSLDEIKGKLAYMAPEQLRRAELDRRSDVFSLGIVLWELSCGRRLFRRKHEGETVVALLQEPIPTPSSVAPDYPKALEAIVMRALMRDPAKRYQNANEMARDLEQFIVESGRGVGHSHVAEAIRGMFGHEIDEHTSSLRRSAELLRHIEELTIPDLEVDMEVGEPVDGESLSLGSRKTAQRMLGKLGRHTNLMIAGGALLLAMAIGVPWLASRGGGAPSTATAATLPPANPPTPVVAAPVAAAKPTAPVEEPAKAAPAASAPESAPTSSKHDRKHKRSVGKKTDAAKATAPPPAASSSQASPATPQKPARRDSDGEPSAPRPMTSFE